MPTVAEMEKKYEKYIKRHQKAVKNSFDAFCALDIPYINENKDRLNDIISKHDESKWSEEEFPQYRKHFDPVNKEEELCTDAYEQAWLHHYMNNPHHWEYWCEVGDDGKFKIKSDIDENEYKLYSIERLMDWCAMSRQFENRVVDWYNQNKDSIVQLESNIPFVEEMLELIDKNKIDVDASDVMHDETNKSNSENVNESKEDDWYFELYNYFKKVIKANNGKYRVEERPKFISDSESRYKLKMVLKRVESKLRNIEFDRSLGVENSEKENILNVMKEYIKKRISMLNESQLLEKASIDWNNFLTPSEVKRVLSRDDKVESSEDVIRDTKGNFYKTYFKGLSKEGWTKAELVQDLSNFCYNGHLNEYGEMSKEDEDIIIFTNKIHKVYPHKNLDGLGYRALKKLYIGALGKERSDAEKEYYSNGVSEKKPRPKFVKSRGVKYSAADDPDKGYNELEESEIYDYSTGAYDGQVDMIAEIRDKDDNVISYVNYSIYDNKIYINMIETKEEYRRKGYATELINYLKKEYSDMEIDYGYTTKDGTGLTDKLEETNGGLSKEFLDKNFKGRVKYNDNKSGAEIKVNEEDNIDKSDFKNKIVSALEPVSKYIKKISISKENKYGQWGVYVYCYNTMSKTTGKFYGGYNTYIASDSNLDFVLEITINEIQSIYEDADTKIFYNENDEDADGEIITESDNNPFPNTKVPQIVYHGSKESFDRFDYDKIGLNGTSHGRGFYFTDDEGMAKGYGETKAYYINIENPLVEGKKTLTRKQVRDALLYFYKQPSDDEDLEDGYALSNFGDVRSEGLSRVLDTGVEATFDYADDDIDIINLLYNNGVTTLEGALKYATKYLKKDGVIYHEDGPHPWSQFVVFDNDNIVAIGNVNEGYNIIREGKQFLVEANIAQLKRKTLTTDPTRAKKSKNVQSTYIGISKYGVLNFKTTSEERNGVYWYQEVQFPSFNQFYNVVEQGDVIDTEDVKKALKSDNIKLTCDDPSFLYWAWKYMAWKDVYGLEKETRAPKRNNTRLRGGLCKHLYSVMDLLGERRIIDLIARDLNQWISMKLGKPNTGYQSTEILNKELKADQYDWNDETVIKDMFGQEILQRVMGGEKLQEIVTPEQFDEFIKAMGMARKRDQFAVKSELEKSFMANKRGRKITRADQKLTSDKGAEEEEVEGNDEEDNSEV